MAGSTFACYASTAHARRNVTSYIYIRILINVHHTYHHQYIPSIYTICIVNNIGCTYRCYFADTLHSLNSCCKRLDSVDSGAEVLPIALLVERGKVCHRQGQQWSRLEHKQVEQVSSEFPLAVSLVELDNTVSSRPRDHGYLGDIAKSCHVVTENTSRNHLYPLFFHSLFLHCTPRLPTHRGRATGFPRLRKTDGNRGIGILKQN